MSTDEDEPEARPSPELSGEPAGEREWDEAGEELPHPVAEAVGEPEPELTARSEEPWDPRVVLADEHDSEAQLMPEAGGSRPRTRSASARTPWRNWSR